MSPTSSAHQSSTPTLSTTTASQCIERHTTPPSDECTSGTSGAVCTNAGSDGAQANQGQSGTCGQGYWVLSDAPCGSLIEQGTYLECVPLGCVDEQASNGYGGQIVCGSTASSTQTSTQTAMGTGGSTCIELHTTPPSDQCSAGGEGSACTNAGSSGSQANQGQSGRCTPGFWTESDAPCGSYTAEAQYLECVANGCSASGGTIVCNSSTTSGASSSSAQGAG